MAIETGAAMAIGAGVSALTGGGQMILQGKSNKKTRQWNEKMYNIQRQHNLQDWERQNKYNSPEETLKRMKEAGLNPALMYDGTGAGGMAAQGIQKAETGSYADKAPDIMGMGMQMQNALMMKAQMDNINADTKLKEADAKKTAGADTALTEAQTLNTIQGTENAKAQEALTKAQTELTKTNAEVAEQTKWQAMGTIQKEYEKISNEVDLLVRQKYITAETQQTVIDTAKAQLTGAYINNVLNRAKTRLTDEQTKAIIEKVKQDWAGLDQKGEEITIKKFEAQIKANYPGLWNVVGRELNDGLSDLWDIIGTPRGNTKK